MREMLSGRRCFSGYDSHVNGRVLCELHPKWIEVNPKDTRATGRKFNLVSAQPLQRCLLFSCASQATSLPEMATSQP